MDLNKKLEELKPYQLNCNVFDVYSYNGLSMQDLLCQFFTKINECIEVSNTTLNLAEWLVNTGLSQEVVKKLMAWLDDGTLENIINENIFRTLNAKIDNNKKFLNDLSINVKEFGCVGDGETDDTEKFEECLIYCMENSKKMYIPSGTYIINRTITSCDQIDNHKSNLPVVIQGENATTVKLNTTNGTKPVLNLSKSKNVIIEEIGSDNSWIQPVQYGEVFVSWNMNRTLFVRNVLSLSREKGYHGYNLLINTPKPSTYDHNPDDSNFYRYPISIQNFSGYNAINIDNGAVDENGGITDNADGSALGIVERANSSVASILLDLTTSLRPSFQVLTSREEVLKSQIRNNPCFEVNYDGHIAVGCSVMNNDPVAKGAGTVKLRDNNPMIRLYDALENNLEYRIQTGDGKIKFVIDGDVPIEVTKNSIKLPVIDTQVKINGFDSSKGVLWQNESGEKRQIYVDESGLLRLTFYEWCNNGDGDHIQTSKSGGSTERPTLRNHNNHDTGFMYFDTDLNKPIWWVGNVWKDAQGNNV